MGSRSRLSVRQWPSALRCPCLFVCGLRLSEPPPLPPFPSSCSFFLSFFGYWFCFSLASIAYSYFLRFFTLQSSPPISFPPLYLYISPSRSSLRPSFLFCFLPSFLPSLPVSDILISVLPYSAFTRFVFLTLPFTTLSAVLVTYMRILFESYSFIGISGAWKDAYLIFRSTK